MPRPVKKSVAASGSHDSHETSSSGRGDSVSYLTRLTRAALLTAQEEQTLAARIAQGSEIAKRQLVEANMRLVVNVARNYHNALIPFEDLVQEGAIGLMTAAERFDPARGYRFSTYATHWIRQAISRAIDNKSKAIRIPAHVSESLRKIERTRLDLHREIGDEPTVEQIALRVGMPAKKVTSIMQSGQEAGFAGHAGRRRGEHSPRLPDQRQDRRQSARGPSSLRRCSTSSNSCWRT